MDSERKDEDEFSHTLFENGPESEALRPWMISEENRFDEIQREEIEEEFQVRPPPDPKLVAEGLRRANPIPADKLMKNIFGIMTELSKELLEDEKELGDELGNGKPSSEISEETPLPELGEPGRIVKRLCAMVIGLCLWMARVLGLKERLGFLRSLINMVKMFEGEISRGDYDGDFANIDYWIRSSNLFLVPEIIQIVSWILNRMVDHPLLSGFLLGAVLV